MAAHFVAMSDLHLGYDRSVWADPRAYDRVAGAVADLCGGSTQYLVLNGDAFEACVPARVGEYDAKIKDLESKAMAAIQANREDLALEVAEAISTLTNERDVEQKQTTEFGGYAESMRKDITKAESRIKSLRQQVDMAKARESVQKAQVSASIASGGANGKLETAVGTLNRLQAKQQQRAAELQAQDQLAEASTGNDLERKLREAGITPDTGSANAILERLKQKSAE